MGSENRSKKTSCSKRKLANIKVRRLLMTLEENRILSKFKPPINGYLLWFLAGVYNVAVSLDTSAGLSANLIVIIQHLSAAGIGVYALARLYFIFVETTFRQILWYMLIITAAFNFGTFIQLSSDFVHKFLLRVN